MVAAFILVFSVAALVQFVLLQCRSIVVIYSGVELSSQARLLAGLENRELTGGEFGRLVRLVRLCPERADDGTQIYAVSAYYTVLQAVGLAVPFVPVLARWVDRDRVRCAHFAAVALDRRVARTSQQTA